MESRKNESLFVVSTQAAENKTMAASNIPVTAKTTISTTTTTTKTTRLASTTLAITTLVTTAINQKANITS